MRFKQYILFTIFAHITLLLSFTFVVFTDKVMSSDDEVGKIVVQSSAEVTKDQAPNTGFSSQLDILKINKNKKNTHFSEASNREGLPKYTSQSNGVYENFKKDKIKDTSVLKKPPEKYDSRKKDRHLKKKVDIQNVEPPYLSEPAVLPDLVANDALPTINDYQSDRNSLDNNESTTNSIDGQANAHSDIPSLEESESLPQMVSEVSPVSNTEIYVDTIIKEDSSPSDINAGIVDIESTSQGTNQTIVPTIKINSEITQKERVIDINDPGGGISFDAETELSEQQNISTTTTVTETPTINAKQLPNETLALESNISTVNPLNISAEEVPMPAFSEWAQKQMEEAEANKIQALEQEQLVVNNSAQKRNHTNGYSKSASLKIRTKNYAAPDCGAKIITSNPDADHTGAVLTNSRDEYMLNPCGTRIWFVVELCEAIQAQKIELANFELFSSSPKNFTVAVSNRFPTRDWSNVGRFTAEDKRTVQSFDLHPHLFGKFVRVDILSHYSKEHFCPVSMFRVFGTSEFEAFETDLRAGGNDLDDFDDEEEQAQAKRTENIFKSASNAVLQIVKKAAEVLVKPTTPDAPASSTEMNACLSPAFGEFTCTECNNTLVKRINTLLSCKLKHLETLLNLPQLRKHFQLTRICSNEYNIKTLPLKQYNNSGLTVMNKKQSYFFSILPEEYIGALCILMSAAEQRKLQLEKYVNTILSPPNQAKNSNNNPEDADVKSANEYFDADLKLNSSCDHVTQEANEPLISLPKTTQPPPPQIEDSEVISKKNIIVNRQIDDSNDVETLNGIKANKIQTSKFPGSVEDVNEAPIPDVNIFNVPSGNNLETVKQVSESQVVTTSEESIVTSDTVTTQTTTTNPTDSTQNVPTVTLRSSDEDATNWDNGDNTLIATETTNAMAENTSTTGGVSGSIINSAPSVITTTQQKLSNGAQTESIFIRLSNRIKALELNISLSSQYLDELSKRYKKQVEELQKTVSQLSSTVQTLEEKIENFMKNDAFYKEQNIAMSNELLGMTIQIQFCIGGFAFLAICVILIFTLGPIYYRKLRRRTQELLLVNAASRNKIKTINQQNLIRRKSFDCHTISDHQSDALMEKQRRPSEQVAMILKECGDMQITSNEINNAELRVTSNMSKNIGSRQRKISVCYDNNINTNTNGVSFSNISEKRKGGGSTTSTNSITDCFGNDKVADAAATTYYNLLKFEQHKNGTKPSNEKTNHKKSSFKIPLSDFEEHLMLDDDLDNFIPNSDLAYNEFMPEGPSGYQIIDNNEANNSSTQDKSTKRKLRRLSSPAFFKSPFGKNKNKSKLSLNAAKLQHQHSVHEPTSWEWHRLKRSIDVQPIHSTPLSTSAHAKFNLKKNSTPNSSYLLEGISITPNANANCKQATSVNGSSSSSSSSERSNQSTNSSTTSSTVKKKNRSFNKFLRNVF